MPAYLICDIEVLDPEGYATYRELAPPTIAAHGGRYIARGGATQVLEGDWSPKRCVLLEFPTMAQLLVWYDSPEYRAVRAIRERTTRSRLVATEGL